MFSIVLQTLIIAIASPTLQQFFFNATLFHYAGGHVSRVLIETQVRRQNAEGLTREINLSLTSSHATMKSGINGMLPLMIVTLCSLPLDQAGTLPRVDNVARVNDEDQLQQRWLDDFDAAPRQVSVFHLTSYTSASSVLE
jgi:hypothetical protein